MKTRIQALAAVLLVIISGKVTAQDAETIVQRMDETLFAAKDQTSNLQIILTDNSGTERTREASIWQKGNDKRLFRFTSPAAEAGIAFLSLPGDVMYLYMPAFGKERRIASHVKNQSFAGTDFSYEDMEAKQYNRDYSSRVLSEAGERFVIELVPLPSVKSDYSKLIIEVNKQHFYPEKMDVYDRGGNLTKSAVYSFVKLQNYWYPREISMRNIKKGHSTRMIMKDVKFDGGISDDIFTVRNLVSY